MDQKKKTLTTAEMARDLSEYLYYDDIDKSDPLYDTESKRLNVELRTAIKRRDFVRAGKISEELEKLELERKVRKAQQCKQLMGEYKRKERMERKKSRWKLNFPAKKRWESKSNM